MEPLRYGLVGSGFVSQFHLRALESVRGVEVAGITSRTPPHELAASARSRGLGEVRVFESVRAMVPEVDVVAIFNANLCRVDVMEEIAAAVRGGARLRGLDLREAARGNLAEARRVVELAREIGAPTAYFENQIHMKMLQQAPRSSRNRPRRWGHSRSSARPRSTAGRTARGSGTRHNRAAACCPTWAVTASRSAGIC